MRLDKWLYYARVYKSRIKSQNACKEGEILVNKIKKNNFNFKISINDIITLILNNKTYVIKVIMLPENRISSKSINQTYELINK